jgi:NDP-sugar pyrophosphorylase family protein
MADEEKKTGLKEKIGLFLDKTFTFGGGLQYDTDIVNSAQEAVGVDSWRDIDTQEDFDKFKSIIRQMQKQKDSGDAPTTGKTGGVVIKMKRGGMVSKNTPKTRSKPSVAGRLAKRGYGKAFKGK